MHWFDWLIMLVPLAMVMFMGFYSRRYIVQVSDFLSAGRLCGRYLLCVADVANALSIFTLIGCCEMYYKTGIAWQFWHNLLLPVGVILGLFGFCNYRFRETKAMSFGQFLEMRYSRGLRIFSAALRSLAEMLANMIMPAIAARFFIYFLDLPAKISCFGLFQIETFTLLLVITLTMAITLICCGGTLALVITDSIQGMICYPLMCIFVIFLLVKFNWNTEIAPVMLDRVQHESFLNPYDIENLRDFNLFYVIYSIFYAILHRSSWIGAGMTSAARSPHEQKMAALLGTFRQQIGVLFEVLIALGVLTYLTHVHFAADAKAIRTQITARVTSDLLAKQPQVRDQIIAAAAALPQNSHQIGKDAPFSEKNNADTPYLETVHRTLLNHAGTNRAGANAVFQKFRTLYYQVMMSVSMRRMLPAGVAGMFCLLMVLAMLSTDDTRIYSATLTTTQDVILPLLKRTLTPQQHLKLVRLVAVGVGVFFFFGSRFMSQMDYINLFVLTMTSMWVGGCGPVMLFGLYSRRGTTQAAWTSILTGLAMALGYTLLNRNWPAVYQWFLDRGQADALDRWLRTLSSPFQPLISWSANPVKCPINAYESAFFTMVTTLILYIVVSLLTCREPFNLERMLHRGKYNLDGDKPREKEAWTPAVFLRKLVGITPEYTRGDKVIAWGMFWYSLVYQFLLAFLAVYIWNIHSRWGNAAWSQYFLWVIVIIPGITAALVAVWFGIGGVRDMIRLFRDLKGRTINHLDNGQVSGHLSLADKEKLEELDRRENGEEPPRS